VLTEEVLKEYLTADTERLNLEHHYWIKNNFLDKVGRMAPNLKELSLRRMAVSDEAFKLLSRELKQLTKLDISYCSLIHEDTLCELMGNNPSLSHLQLSYC